MEINEKHLPYTPGDGTDHNPHALMRDSLNFSADGIVDQVSVIRTITNGDTTVVTRRKRGYYDLENLPIVLIDWDEQGVFLYALRHDTLSVAVPKVGEQWKYKLVPRDSVPAVADRWMSAPYQP